MIGRTPVVCKKQTFLNVFIKNCYKTIPKPYQNHAKPCQNHTKTMPKPCQNHAKTMTTHTKTIPKPYQNPYPNHTQTIPKPYQNYTPTMTWRRPTFITGRSLSSGTLQPTVSFTELLLAKSVTTLVAPLALNFGSKASFASLARATLQATDSPFSHLCQRSL